MVMVAEERFLISTLKVQALTETCWGFMTLASFVDRSFLKIQVCIIEVK